MYSNVMACHCSGNGYVYCMHACLHALFVSTHGLFCIYAYDYQKEAMRELPKKQAFAQNLIRLEFITHPRD